MGMFDYVTYKANCPYCGAVITEWQTKDGGCNLDHVPYDSVDSFHTSCPKCKGWVQAYVDKKVVGVRVVADQRKWIKRTESMNEDPNTGGQ